MHQIFAHKQSIVIGKPKHKTYQTFQVNLKDNEDISLLLTMDPCLNI